MVADIFLSCSRRVGAPIAPGARILDFGCGAGAMVRALAEKGFDAYGFDMFNYLEEASKPLRDRFSFFREKEEFSGSYKINFNAFTLPYPDNFFDAVFSSQVFEHIQNHEVTMREFARIMKPDGVSINVFPPRTVFIEPHIFIPFAHIIRSKWYYRLAALCGIRNQFQHGMSIKSIAEVNYTYVVNSLCYLPNRQLLKLGKQFFKHAVIDQKAFYRIEGELSPLYEWYLSHFKPSICLVLARKIDYI